MMTARETGAPAWHTALCALLLWLASIGGAESAPAVTPTPGMIWSPAERRPLTGDELHERLEAAELVLIGEVHDNPHGHRWQARLLETHLRPGDRVGFEQLGADDAALLASAEARELLARHELDDALHWADSGWPPWPLYRPLLAAALASQAVVRGLELERGQARRVMSDGFGAVFSGEELASTGVEDHFDAGVRAVMAQEIRAAHCDALPEAMAAPMVRAQIARDAAMALRLRHGTPGRSFVIAGNGHVRKDWGMPQFLARLHPEAALLSIQIVEIFQPEATLSDFPQADPTQSDVVIFVTAQERDDPCAALRSLGEQKQDSGDQT